MDEAATTTAQCPSLQAGCSSGAKGNCIISTHTWSAVTSLSAVNSAWLQSCTAVFGSAGSALCLDAHLHELVPLQTRELQPNFLSSFKVSIKILFYSLMIASSIDRLIILCSSYSHSPNGLQMSDQLTNKQQAQIYQNFCWLIGNDSTNCSALIPIRLQFFFPTIN